MIDRLINYSKALNASDDVFWWIQNTGLKSLNKKVLTESEIEHIIDYFISDASPNRLKKMSWKDAKRKAKDWSESNQKKGKDLIDGPDDLDVKHEFDDGSKIVHLKSKSAFQREGFLMSHCVGGYDPESGEYDIYSYRDSENMPHATFEVRKNSEEIVQIKGKGNGPIHPKYINPILKFLEVIGMDIRPNDMKNLGYYHIDKMHISFLKKTPNAWDQVYEIRGEYYAF